MTDSRAIIAENITRIRQQVAEAANRSGRTAQAVTLVAVTKYVESEIIEDVVASGCVDLGESRPQQFWDKAEQLSHCDIRWHFIGHLQRNKVARTIPHTALVHSVDSERLLAEIDQVGLKTDRKIPVLLEVNVSEDVSKHGFSADEVQRFLEHLPGYPNVAVRGLMTMAAFHGGDDVARTNFAALRQLRDALVCNCPPCATLDELSMGMSRDYGIAIEEGATLVRVGSSLYEGISL